jgi:hypothetical protein
MVNCPQNNGVKRLIENGGGKNAAIAEKPVSFLLNVALSSDRQQARST